MKWCIISRSLSLTPVMTAPLVQLRDSSRKDSSSVLQPMTATGDSTPSALDDSWSRSVRHLTLDPRLSGQSWRFPELLRGGSHTLSLSLPRSDPHPSLPTPSLPVSSEASSSYSSRWWRLTVSLYIFACNIGSVQSFHDSQKNMENCSTSGDIHMK